MLALQEAAEAYLVSLFEGRLRLLVFSWSESQVACGVLDSAFLYCRYQLVCHSCQACDHHAKGHSAGQAYQRRACLEGIMRMYVAAALGHPYALSVWASRVLYVNVRFRHDTTVAHVLLANGEALLKLSYCY